MYLGEGNLFSVLHPAKCQVDRGVLHQVCPRLLSMLGLHFVLCCAGVCVADPLHQGSSNFVRSFLCKSASMGSAIGGVQATA